MSGRVIVRPARPAEEQTAPTSSYDVGQKVRAALWAMVFVWLLVTTALWTILALASLAGQPCPGGWRPWVGALALALVVAVSLGSYLGYRWVCEAAARAWRVDDRIRQRVWQREDIAQQEQEAAADAAKRGVQSGPLDHDGDPTTSTSEQRLHLVAISILERAYVTGKPVTREAMEAEGLCTQAEWNLTNRCMKAVGLKVKKTMASIDFQTAWSVWSAGVKVEPGDDGTLYVWVVRRSGGWYALERIGE